MQKKITTVVLFAILALSTILLVPYATLATPKEEAIAKGVAWLAQQQNPTTGEWTCSMHGTYPVAATGLAVVKLCEHAKKPPPIGLDMDPFDPAYMYKENVEKGLEYLFLHAVAIDINIEHGFDDPDVNLVNGQGIYFVSPGQNRPIYETGIVMMALEASCHPDFEADASGSPVDGWTYLDVMKDAVDYISWAQNDEPNVGRGGWRYGAYDDGVMVGPGFGAPDSDNSVSQWPVLGLLSAGAWGVHAPAWVKSELLNHWLEYSQGGDGCFGYTHPGVYTASGPFGVTASGLIQLSYCGVPISDPRWVAAANCICSYWDLHNIGNLYAMYGLMKAAMTATPEIVWEFCEYNWQEEYDEWLITHQHLDGYWEADGYWADEILATEWALLILQKIAPPPPTIPVYIDIKPCSWPNPINVKSKGKFAVAVCGTEDFDAMTIDPATVKIHIEGIEEGVPPLRWSCEDVATPYMGEPGGGHALCGDGYVDLVLHFDTQDVVGTLMLTGEVGETVPLVIRGNLYEELGGTPIQGEDYAWILG